MAAKQSIGFATIDRRLDTFAKVVNTDLFSPVENGSTAAGVG